MSAAGEARPRLSSDAGTTLVEALVVVTLTVMVGAIVLPAVGQSLMTLGRRQAVAVVAARLREARAGALRHDAPVVFSIAANGAAYGTSDGEVSPTPPGVTLSIPRPDNLGRGGRIIFYGDGSSTGGSVAVSGGQRTTRIFVAPLGGAVAVEDS
jgi:general secretion pathway protein H